MDLLHEKMRLKPMSGPQDSGGGGGGGGSPVQQQTAIAELPEWARPYAQKVLAKGEALTEGTTPAIYGGQRYAGLSDLQKKAIESVSTPETYQKSLQTFMDPYAQNVIDIQKREAGRQSAMAGLQEAGQAVKAGAFGGSRAGLVEAERARNLGQLMGDIQQRGSEAAYQNAQQALQRDIANKMQLGTVQQQDIQRPLDIAYQDFINQQNYPYKQLGFMSDLIRGLPLGQQSTSQVYQSPGSITGQLAGLGLGAYGMSRMFGFAEGGEVYADGGVTDDRNIESILANLSDDQLLQAKKAAVNARDEMKIAMIDQEMAQRASMRHGLGSVPIDFAAYLPDEEAMASGGIVAFADGDLVSDDTIYDPVSGVPIAGPSSRTGEDRTLREVLGLGNVENRRAVEAAERRARLSASGKSAPAPKVQPTARDQEIMAKADAEQQKEAAPAPKTQKAPSASISNAARIITNAARTEVPKDDLNKLYEEISGKLNSAPRPEAEALSRMLEKAEQRSEEIKARGIGDALMKFGFGMASAAAKPGQARRAGLAGLLESGAAAAPILAESVAENQKLQAAAEDNALKLRMEQARYQSALEQGNRQLAASLAGSISQRNLQQAALQEQITQNERANALKEKELSAMAAYRSQASEPSLVKIAERYMKEDPKLSFDQAMDKASRTSGYSFRTEGLAGGKLAAALSKIEEDYKMLPALMAGNPNSPFTQNMAAERQRRIGEVYRLYGTEQQPSVTSNQPPAAGAGQMKLLNVR